VAPRQIQDVRHAREPDTHVPVAEAAAGTAWSSILTGVERERALRAIQMLAASVATASDADASLSAGAAGRAVLYAELAFTSRFPDAAARRDAELEQAVEILASAPLGASLFAGFSGIAWAAEISAKLRTEQMEDLNEEIDDAVLQVLDRVDWKQAPFDLIYGITGLGVYAAERMPRAKAEEALDRVVAELGRCAREDADGAFWWTAPHNLLGPRREQYPGGGVDLGVAHGIAGPIAVLALAAALGVRTSEATALADRGVRWLLTHAIDSETGPTIPYFIGAEEGPTPARLAWCYGDPGVGAVLVAAGRTAQRPDWIEAGKRLALGAAARPPEQSGVSDVGFCHGSAGLAHLFNRIYQATGEPSLRETAEFWLAQTLERLSSDDVQPPYNGLGLLEGAAGVALVLLAAASDHEPQWDRMYVTAPVEAAGRSRWPAHNAVSR
jgi:hypothetical protein